MRSEHDCASSSKSLCPGVQELDGTLAAELSLLFIDDCHKWALCIPLVNTPNAALSAHGAAVVKGPTPAVQRQLHTPRRPPL